MSFRNCWKEIERRVNEIGLSLNEKTAIYPLKNGIDFLGFHTYLTETGGVIRKVRRKSKSNARRKLKKMRGLLEAGKIAPEAVKQSYQSWRGHAAKGNCYHLIRNMDQYYNSLFKPQAKEESTVKHTPETPLEVKCCNCRYYHTSLFCGYYSSHCDVYGSLDMDQTERHPDTAAMTCPNYTEKGE